MEPVIYLSSRVVKPGAGLNRESYHHLDTLSALDFLVNQLLAQAKQFIFCDRSIYVRLITIRGDERMVLLEQEEHARSILPLVRVSRMFLLLRELDSDSVAIEALRSFREDSQGFALVPLGENFSILWAKFFPAHTLKLAIILGLLSEAKPDQVQDLLDLSLRSLTADMLQRFSPDDVAYGELSHRIKSLSGATT
jgi:hypothetical protein